MLVWFGGVGAFSVNLSPLSTIHRGEKIKPTVCSTHPTCVYFVLWEDFIGEGLVNIKFFSFGMIASMHYVCTFWSFLVKIKQCGGYVVILL